MIYELSDHARQRITERKITPDELADALAGREIVLPNRTFHYGKATRTLIVADPPLVLTVYRATRKWIKAALSR